MLDQLLEIRFADIVDVGVVGLLEIRFADIVDIGVVGLLLWALIAWAHRVRAHLALLGLAFLGLFYLIAIQLELQLTAWLFQGFFAVLVILLVVVFQDDLRRLFEQIAVLGLRRRRNPAPGMAATLYGALTQLARRRTGALLVIVGREPLERHLQGGIALDATISEELLYSLFDTHSPGHDGAVLVQGNRLIQFAVHLPLSEDRTQLGPGGTRHAAGLGLAERSDALCVIVSEERGTISIAHLGRLRTLDEPEQLRVELQNYLESQGTRDGKRKDRWLSLRRHLLEGGAAFALALASWVAFVPGSTIDKVTREVPVVVENMPEGFALEQVSPPVLQVTVIGPRRELLLAQTADFEVVINALLVELGRRTFTVSGDAVRHTTDLEVIAVEPEKVRISVSQKQPTTP